MNIIINKQSALRLTSFTLYHLATTSKRSYYQILQLKPNFTQKDLRKQFLAKGNIVFIEARMYHPDHNKSQQAQKQFKLLKQAYQTLKDGQKKHMYDSGISQTDSEVSPVHHNEVKSGRKYYENKWYGYNKPKAQDLRDQYYKAKQSYFQEKPINYIKHGVTFLMILLAIFGYDILTKIDTTKNKTIEDANMILDGSVNESNLTKKQILLKKYMQKRVEANKVDF